MSELRSVIAFFLGLVFFVVIIGLAIGRIRLPNKNAKTTTVTELVTPTPKIVPTKKPGIFEKLGGIFKKATPTPKPTKTELARKPGTKEVEVKEVEVVETSTPISQMKQALEPEQQVKGTIVKKGGEIISVDRFTPTTTTKGGVETIPESGSPTLLLPLAMFMGGLGKKLLGKK